MQEWNITGNFVIETPRFEEIRKQLVQRFNPEGKNKFTANYFFQKWGKGADGRPVTHAGGLIYNRYKKLRLKLSSLNILKDTDTLDTNGECF